jgi:hypothetical protein
VNLEIGRHAKISEIVLRAAMQQVVHPNASGLQDLHGASRVTDLPGGSSAIVRHAKISATVLRVKISVIVREQVVSRVVLSAKADSLADQNAKVASAAGQNAKVASAADLGRSADLTDARLVKVDTVVAPSAKVVSAAGLVAKAGLSQDLRAKVASLADQNVRAALANQVAQSVKAVSVAVLVARAVDLPVPVDRNDPEDLVGDRSGTAVLVAAASNAGD